MKKIIFTLCLSCMFIFAATPKDTLIIAVENELERINPVFSEDHDSALALIFSGLTRYDENMQIQGDLAKSWTISKNGLEYEFELRDDVSWHDGVKFGAKDVKFSLETLLDPKLNAPTKANFNAIKKVEILSENKVKITLKTPFPPLLDVLSLGIIPAHLLENKDINTDKFNQNPIGTGAFKFKELKKGQYILLEANENFHLGKVKSKKLILRTINDLNLAAIELKAGKIDASLISFEQAQSFKKDKRFKVLEEDSADYRALMFNFHNTILQDQKVRLALNYAVDKKLIIEKLLHGLGEVAHHPLQKSWVNPENFTKFEYNPTKATQLLESAGWKKNSKQIYEKNGKELEFEIWTMSNDSLRVTLTNFLISEFSKIGIKAKGIAKPAGSFDYSKVDSFLVGWGSPNDPDLHTYRVFGSIEKDWNFGHYKDKKVDKALQNARTSLNLDKRKAEYKKFIEALHENPPFIFLAYLKFPLAYHKDIKGVKAYVLGHHGVGFAYNAWQWSK